MFVGLAKGYNIDHKVFLFRNTWFDQTIVKGIGVNINNYRDTREIKLYNYFFQN
jgi:hypothetical protein